MIRTSCIDAAPTVGGVVLVPMQPTVLGQRIGDGGGAGGGLCINVLLCSECCLSLSSRGRIVIVDGLRCPRSLVVEAALHGCGGLRMNLGRIGYRVVIDDATACEHQ